MSGLLHWLDTDLWGPLWPNVVAPSLWTILAIVISHMKRARQAERHHQEMKDHITATAGKGQR